MTRSIPKAELFARLGYAGCYDELERVLQAADLSRPDKVAISLDKEPEVSARLHEQFIAVCSRGDCRTEAHESDDERMVIPAASAAHCEICHGSSNARAVDVMVDALTSAGMRRLCVVGGAPTTRRRLRELVGGRVDLRVVDGTGSRTSTQARADLAWADLVAIWGATPLDHSVSSLYHGAHVIQLARRGIRALAGEVTRSVTNEEAG